jgi:phosphoheptose isomerase
MSLTYAMDIDNTICITDGNHYLVSQPIKEVIDWVNKLYDEGNEIVFFTGRGSKSGEDWREWTKAQLATWGVKYHKLIFGKPHYDIIVDDKALQPSAFIEQAECGSNPRTQAPWQFGQATAEAIAKVCKNGNKVLICGNGGLAAESDHFAAELMGDFGVKDTYIRCLSLGANLALITAIANDRDFSEIFAHQISIWGDAGDVLIVMTGGKPDESHSRNIIRALEQGRVQRMYTVVICGSGSGFFEADNIWRMGGMGVTMQNQAIQFLHWLALESKKRAVR